MSTSFQTDEIEQVFTQYQPEYRMPLLQLREWVFETAKGTEGVGPLEESLKWGQPSYLTSVTRSGTTIRMDWFEEGKIALFFNCQTPLVESFRTMFGDTLSYSKNRAVIFDVAEPLPEQQIRQCLQKALTYHLDKKTAARQVR